MFPPLPSPVYCSSMDSCKLFSISSTGEISDLFWIVQRIRCLGWAVGYCSRLLDQCTKNFFSYVLILVFAHGDPSCSLCYILIRQTSLWTHFVGLQDKADWQSWKSWPLGQMSLVDLHQGSSYCKHLLSWRILSARKLYPDTFAEC